MYHPLLWMGLRYIVIHNIVGISLNILTMLLELLIQKKVTSPSQCSQFLMQISLDTFKLVLWAQKTIGQSLKITSPLNSPQIDELELSMAL